ncbi:hypothetical protein CsatB_025172 [Cannabis sativa]
MNPVALSPPSDSLVSHCHSNGSTGTPLTTQQSFSIVSNLTAATVSRRLSLPQSQLTFILVTLNLQLQREFLPYFSLFLSYSLCSLIIINDEINS